MKQLKFDFEQANYVFENEIQEKLFYKIQENHTWKNKYMYGQEYWIEKLYNDILNIDNNLLKDIYDLLFQICPFCKLQYYGWPKNENKYNLNYEIYRFDNDSYIHLFGIFSLINLIKKTHKCISCLEKENKIKYDPFIEERWIKYEK